MINNNDKYTYPMDGTPDPDEASASPFSETLAFSEEQMTKILPVSKRTLFDLRQRGEIPFVRLGVKILYPADEVRCWIKGLPRGDR